MTEDAVFEEYRSARESGGDGQDALVSLYPLLRQHIESIIWLKLREHDPPLAAAIANEILHEIGAFRGNSKFSTWVYAIARNHIYDELQRRKREVPLDPASLECIEAADVAMRLPYDRLFLQQILERLAPEEQQLVLGRMHGETYEEIAEHMDVKVPALRTRWEDLTRKLRREYGHANP